MKKNSFSLNQHFRRGLLAGVGVLVVSVTSGCATSGNSKDPIEGFNRVVFAFNDGLDAIALRPVAKLYDAALPKAVQRGISNFFGNLDDVFTGVNNVLQGKPGEGISDIARVLINSSVGVLGIFDWATDMGLEKHNEDFGQTFGRWGIGAGPYLVLPLFGPKSLRDGTGYLLDSQVDPISNIADVSTRNATSGLRLIDKRAQLLPADKVIEEAALDKYSYLRDAYLQYRLSAVYDGNPPRRNFDDE
jgi:phospholipid-binding lipoprotein MlaA